MRYFWIGIGYMFSLTVSIVFAQTLDLQVSTTQADINTPITATLTIDSVEGGGSVAIAGIESFDVLNQSRAQSLQIINGQQRGQVQLTLSLQPKAVGTYTLGPATVQVNGTDVASQSFVIEVSGESLFGTNANVLAQPEVQREKEPRSFDWIVWAFGAIVVALIRRVYKVFRVKQRKTFGDISSTQGDAAGSSTIVTTPDQNQTYASNPRINSLLDYVIQNTPGVDAKTSIGLLSERVQDGNLQGLLMRVEESMYSGSMDPLLEEDITVYLQERNDLD